MLQIEKGQDIKQELLQRYKVNNSQMAYPVQS